MTWKKIDLETSGSAVTPSQNNGKLIVDGSEVTVYDDSSLTSLATHNNRTTLDKLSENGSELLFNGTTIGTEVAVNGRNYANFALRGSVIYIKKGFRTSANTLEYWIPPLDTDRYRRLFVWGATGSRKSVHIQDGVLEADEGLIYNYTENTIVKRHGTWGNIAVSENEYLLLYNSLGRISGILSKYCITIGESLSIPIKELEVEEISETGSTQGIFIIEDKLFVTMHSNDEHTTYENITMKNISDMKNVRTISHNFGHLNACDYSHQKDSLIVGNGSGNYSLPLKGWIIPNFKHLMETVDTLEFYETPKVELDFTHIEESKCNMCWGYDSTDIIYLFTNDNSKLRKIVLGKGDDDKGTGVFVSGASENEYNGSYEILDTWVSTQTDILGGMIFYKGYIYTGIKGNNRIRKCIPKTDGSFDSVYLPFRVTGDMQGIHLDKAKEYFYAFSAFRGTRFNTTELYG